MKRLLVLVLTLWFLVLYDSAFATWPFGNIGLNVDKPIAQLDVGGPTVSRGPLLLNNPSIPPTNYYSWATNFLFNQTNAILGFPYYSNPGYISSWSLTASSFSDSTQTHGFLHSSLPFGISGNQFGVHAVRTSTSQNSFYISTNYIGRATFIYTNASHSITNILPIGSRAVESSAILSSTSTWSGACVALYFSKTASSTVPVHIFTRQGGQTGTFKLLISIQNTFPTFYEPWFEVSCSHDIRVELFRTDSFLEPDSIARISLLSVTDTHTGQPLTPTFFGSHGWTLLVDNTNLDP